MPIRGGSGSNGLSRLKISWLQFEKGILLRFRHGDYGNLNESLCKLKHRGGFSKYLREFERLVHCLLEWPEEALIGVVMAGLKEEIATEVRLFKLNDF